ncbi:unnamed protein product [Adineta steineri]|uniref:Uncharacterized protein n=1 Tax=Adineta steineri TaxID=433720 RepID=A0A815JC23_9BILA|nr:unnamed protein product [Adineta steineri]CAF1378801.1 unnamed protein product [Adineta steineri]CAF1606770.1 unnamed protein product [Adineta steineri]CAF1606786.1 unnamed protein product [Adineta steineri]
MPIRASIGIAVALAAVLLAAFCFNDILLRLIVYLYFGIIGAAVVASILLFYAVIIHPLFAALHDRVTNVHDIIV